MESSWPHDLPLPDPGLPLRERLVCLVEAARLAPSIRNTQPWRFRVDASTVDVMAERSRSLPVADPEGRGLHVSCGAALGFLEVAAHAAGLATAIERAPAASEAPDRVARMRITGEARPSTEEPWLVQAMPKRRTHRGVFSSHRVSPSLLRRLIALADAHGAPLTIVEGPARHELLAIVGEADRAQRRDPEFRRELAAWVTPGRAGLGMPAHAGELAAIAAGEPTCLRTFAWADGEDPESPTLRPATGEMLDAGSPVLAILTTHGDDPGWWLRAGETLARVLLRGRVDHLWGSFLGAPIEVPAARAELRARLGLAGFPQVVLRLGYAGDLAPTPRLGRDEVLAGA